MESYNNLLKNSYIFAIGNFGSKFITIIMLPFYTRMLSQTEYGQIDIITTTISLLLPILTVNIVEAVVRFSLDKENYSYKEVLTNSLIFVLIGFIELLILYPFIKWIDIINSFGILFYGLFIIQALHTSIKQFIRSIGLTKIYMISDLLYTFIFVTLNILFLSTLKIGIYGYILSMIIALLIDAIFLGVKGNIHRYIDGNSIKIYIMRDMFKYCLPLIPNSVMWWIMNISDRYIIMYFCGLSSTGIYAVANKFPSIISNMYRLFFNAWQISAIEEYTNKNRNKFYSNVFNTFFFIMMNGVSIYIILNELIIKCLVGKEFYSASKYAPILVIAVVFSSFSGFLGTNYTASKKTRGAFYTSFIGALLNIGLNIILVPNYGLYGASIATMISFATMWIARVIDTRNMVNIEYPFRKIIPIILIIFVQLLIFYSNMPIMIKYTINVLLLFFNMTISKEYIKKPIFIFINKIHYKLKSKNIK